MLANKQEISCNGNGLRSPRRIRPTVDIQNKADAFATTHWSLVLTAQGQSVAAEEALEELCRIYWRPLYAFARRQDCDPEQARDLTQGFFELLLKRRDLDAAHREKGRLRSYLLASFKHFLGGERRKEMTIKRGYGQWLIPLEELRATGNAFLFDSLKLLLPDEPDAPSRAEIAARLGMTDNALRQAFHRFRHRYQTLLREEIGHTVADPGEIEDELRQLIVVLRS
jgi:RNA polymerase sigma-70 factor (ECF subfamily)